jgi:hypothetical protein
MRMKMWKQIIAKNNLRLVHFYVDTVKPVYSGRNKITSKTLLKT